MDGKRPKKKQGRLRKGGREPPQSVMPNHSADGRDATNPERNYMECFAPSLVIEEAQNRFNLSMDLFRINLKKLSPCRSLLETYREFNAKIMEDFQVSRPDSPVLEKDPSG